MADMAGPGTDTFHRLQQFLFEEAAMLDERRFGSWLELFAPDGVYWVPMAWQQPDPHDHVSLIYETYDLLSMRLSRLVDPATASQLPPTRTCHHIGNVVVMAMTESGECRLRSALTVVEYRRNEQRLFAGYAHHDLTPHGESWRIRTKRVDLLNCDTDIGHLRMGVPL